MAKAHKKLGDSAVFLPWSVTLKSYCIGPNKSLGIILAIKSLCFH